MSDPIVLTGKGLTLELVMDVARRGRNVTVDKDAVRRLNEGRHIVFELMETGTVIYGGNTGVGWNKDLPVERESIAEFNRNFLHSHAAGVGPYASVEETRAALLIRLNTLLVGCTGISPQIPLMISEFINRGIHPMIPERGSVGEADIACLAHLGLALLGEGKVLYRGKEMPAMKALKAEKLMPIELGAKDGLAITSSNALGSGQAAVTVHEAIELVAAAEIIYCMSLEGFNGNTSPLDPRVHAVHGFNASAESAGRISRYLTGSYLHAPQNARALQDPLCYRNGAHLYGAASQALDDAAMTLFAHFNHSDDNPCLLAEDHEIISCANFDSLPLALKLENAALVLSHLSKAACLRAIKLANPVFTGLSRNLTPGSGTIGFSTIQKTFASLDAEIRLLANPISMDTFSLAGEMEDLSSNAPLVAQKLRKITDNLRYVFAIELILAAQAMDLRGDVAFGRGTAAVRAILREKVPFYRHDDHCVTDDIYAAHGLLKTGAFLKLARETCP
jgi:histidine ammonia-lyase